MGEVEGFSEETWAWLSERTEKDGKTESREMNAGTYDVKTPG